MPDIFDAIQLNEPKGDVFDKVSSRSRGLSDKALSLVTMGHVGGEYGPEEEVRFTKDGKMIRADVPSGDPGFFEDPITALAMGGVAGARAAINPLRTAAREAIGWFTGGGSEVPGLVKSGAKGVAKAASSKPLAEQATKRQEKGFLESISPEAKVTETVATDVIKPTSKAVPKTTDIFDLESLDPMVKGGMTGNTLPKYAEGSAINLERIDSTLDVKNFINGLTEKLEPQIGKHKVSWEQTRSEAEALGWNIADVKKAWKRKGSFTAAEIEATRQTNLNTSTDLHEMIRSLPADRSQWTPANRAQLLDAMDLVKVTSQAASEAGRSLNMHKKVLSNDPSFTDAVMTQKILKKLNGKGSGRTDDIMDALKNLSETGWDPADVNRFIYNITKTPWEKLSDSAFELWINGLLSHPLTHVVNATSNILTLTYGSFERTGAAGLEAVRALVTNTPRQIFFREGAEDIFSFHGGLQAGFSRFANAMRYGDRATKLDTPVSALPERISRVLPTRALIAEDAFFKGLIEHSELNRLAFRKARAENLRGEALRDRIVDLTTNPTSEMLEAAAKRGKYLTYQKELGEVGSLVMRARDTVPGLKYFIPFVKTPTNIAKFALERTPLNFPRLIAKAAKGELKGAELSEELAKPLMGSLLAFTAYELAEQGKITGGGPKDKAAREAKQNTGWLPYAYKTGDGTYISFQRLEPIGSILGMAADLSELKRDMKENEKFDLATAVSGSITNNISNKTFMQGFTNAINAISDPGSIRKKRL